MNTSSCTVVGVFDDYATAQRAADRLTAAGFNRDDIQVMADQQYATASAGGRSVLSGTSQTTTTHHTGSAVGDFFRDLFGTNSDDSDWRNYPEAVRRGGTIVSVSTTEERQNQAADILEEFGAVDVDQRAATWGGNTNYADTRTARGTDGERTIPVVQEELRVGKRAVQRGGVRIFNRMTEQPVQEQVNLREERVRVDRRPADRPATDADLRMRDEVIEVTEMAEEPVVDKRTRVVEEVVVSKEATERTETIRDSVRRSDVNVEKLGSGDRTTYDNRYDDDFRTHFKSRYGTDRSLRYEDYAPAYQYGYTSASDERYRGRSWDEVEPTLRTDYERRYPNSAWERFKDSVRYGWEKVTGRR